MQEILTAVGCLVLGGYVILEAAGYPRQGDVEMHPGHYPGILGYIMVALGICLVGKLLWKGWQKAPASDMDRPRLAILVAALVAYSFVMESLGYAVSTFLFVAAAVYLFRGSVKTSLITGVSSALVLAVVFRYIFRAPLPAGILF